MNRAEASERSNDEPGLRPGFRSGPAPRHRAFLALAVLAPIALSLAACSTTGGGSRSATGAYDSTAGRVTAPARARGGAQGGRYYLDDGPADFVAVDPASVPDATPRVEPLLARTMRPYSVFGRRYTPMAALEPYRERGFASWYGRRYHGQPTSSGERYDMFAMSAAHPTLPIPSYVRVTHLGNGRSVVVRVNDRGPFLQDRLIDLSYTAAAKLGYVQAGSAEVEVELITQFGSTATAADEVAATPPVAEEKPQRLDVETTVARDEASTPSGASPGGFAPPPALDPGATRAPALAVSSVPAAVDDGPAQARTAPAPARGFWLQFGAYASIDSARAALARLASELDWLDARFDLRREGAFYKVQAGPWTRREHALAIAERVRNTTPLRPFATFR